jgi:STE24 endopeptidase
MQFLVFAAFAIVLSVPEGGPPWETLHSRAGTWAVVFGQLVLAALAGGICSARVRRQLDRDPARLHAAQSRLSSGNMAVRLVLGLGLVASVYLTDWTRIVRGWNLLGSVWGVDELVILLPFFLAILVGLLTLYPADRAVREVALDLRLWASAPARPVWRLGQYLSFNFRQNVLIIALPMLPILVANDLTNAYSGPIRKWAGLAWADQAVLVAVAGLVFLVAPMVLRHIWHTRALPEGELRDRLEDLCRRIGLTYRRILIWESDGMVVNAAVMGMARPVRYILLSDGLLELMDDEKIEAVFGHEAGHVKLRHIEFYLLFAIVSMFVVGGVFELLQAVMRHWPKLLPVTVLNHEYAQVAAMGLIVLVWGLGFGFISRRFEWQADLFGAHTVTPPPGECSRPCLVHGTVSTDAPQDPSCLTGTPASELQAGSAVRDADGVLCATAAQTFAEALHRIAALNGIPLEARSWRHSSIANRMRRLEEYTKDARLGRALGRSVTAIKWVLALGTIAGLVIGSWLYWPK